MHDMLANENKSRQIQQFEFKVCLTREIFYEIRGNFDLSMWYDTYDKKQREFF